MAKTRTSLEEIIAYLENELAPEAFAKAKELMNDYAASHGETAKDDPAHLDHPFLKHVEAHLPTASVGHVHRMLDLEL